MDVSTTDAKHDASEDSVEVPGEANIHQTSSIRTSVNNMRDSTVV